jgi:hypothetical protein
MNIDDTFDRSQKNPLVLEVFNEANELVSRTVDYNSRVQAGGVAVAAAIFGGTGISFKYVALSNNSGFAPANGDTTVSGEITTLGLSRATGSVTLASSQASLNSTAATTITATWSVTGTTTIYGAGLLSASSGGTLGFEATCTATPVANGYTVNLSWTLNE